MILLDILEVERLIEKLSEKCKTQKEAVDLKLHLKSVIESRIKTDLIDEELITSPTGIRARHEARSWAWFSLGVSGNISHKLADMELHPKEIKEILREKEIHGISHTTKLVIKNLTENDFEKFDSKFEKLMNKNSWPWKLSEWFYGLPNGCTCYEYERMRVKLRKKHID